MIYFILQAYLYTKSRRLVGIELNEELCVLQQRIINKHHFQASFPFVLYFYYFVW